MTAGARHLKRLVAEKRVFVALSLALLVLIAVLPSVAFAQAAPSTTDGACSFTSFNLIDCLSSGLGKFIAMVALLFTEIAATELGVIGQFFNGVMNVMVFRFADYFGNSSGLLLAWTILRDFANIALLFGFIFMGIATILDIHSYTAKKTLPALIIFAVLLNFSLFAAEAVVDASNVVSSTFYTQASGGIDCRNDQNADTCAQQGLAGQMIQATGLNGILGIDNAGTSFGAIFTAPDGILAGVVFLSLFALVVATGVILLAASIMLLSRAITLVIVFVTSPIGFAGMAIPPLQSLSNRWWKALIDNAIFAPAFMLLMLASLKVLEGIRGAIVPPNTTLVTILTNQTAAAGTSAANTGGVLILFALAIGFMIAALRTAKELGIMGADKVVGFAEQTIGRAVGGVAFGVPARIYRSTVGSASNRVAQNIRSSRFGSSLIGRNLARVADVGATSSGDLRGTGLLGKTFGEVSKTDKEGRRGALKAAGEAANKDAKAFKDAFKAADAPFLKKGDDLERKANLARADRAKAEEKGKAGKVAALDKKIGNITKEKENNAKALEKARAARLTGDDRKLYEYFKSVGEKPSKDEVEVQVELDGLAEAIDRTTAESKRAADEITRLKTELARDPARHDELQTEIAHQEAVLEAANNAASAAQRATQTGEAHLRELRKKRKTDPERIAALKKAEAYTKPDIAMTTLARKIDSLAKVISATPGLNIVIDTGRMRAGAAAIRSEGGKSEKDQAWEHIRHLMEHGDHAEEAEHAEESHPAQPSQTRHAPADNHDHSHDNHS